MNCLACDLPGTKLCPECEDVRALVDVFEPETLALVVDGSFANGHGGAGLVLSSMGEPIATRALGFACRSSKSAEYRAITIGLRWASGADVHSDCIDAISMAQRKLSYPHIVEAWQLTWIPEVHFLPKIARYPLHELAHQLANRGRREYAERVESEREEMEAMRHAHAAGLFA